MKKTTEQLFWTGLLLVSIIIWLIAMLFALRE